MRQSRTHILLMIALLSVCWSVGCDDEPELPPARETRTVEKKYSSDTTVVRLTSNAQIYLNETEVNAEELESKLNSLPKLSPVALDIDPANSAEAEEKQKNIVSVLFEFHGEKKINLINF